MTANANADAIIARDTDMSVAKERLTSSSPSTTSNSSSTWNTNRLGSRLGIDAASAATAGILTCPVITVIDRYIAIPMQKFPILKTQKEAKLTMSQPEPSSKKPQKASPSATPSRHASAPWPGTRSASSSARLFCSSTPCTQARISRPTRSIRCRRRCVISRSRRCFRARPSSWLRRV